MDLTPLTNMRAKFRVMEISHHHGGITIVRLRPVKPKSGSDDDGSEENRLFFAASPAGEASVRLEAGEVFPAAIEEAVYVDFSVLSEPQKGDWWISSAQLHPGNGQLDVTFAPSQGWTTQVQLVVQQRVTVRRLLPVVVDAFTQLAPLPGAEPDRPHPVRWSVSFSAAPG